MVICWKRAEPRQDKIYKVSVRPVKTQISLSIRPFWSESSLSARRNLGTVKTLTRLSGCPGWSESSLGVPSFCWFCHEAAQLFSWISASVALYLSLVTRKPVFGVSDQIRLKPAYSASETSQRLEILDIETRGILPSRQRTTKRLIRLPGCAGWSAPLLFAYGKSRFSHDVAHLVPS